MTTRIITSLIALALLGACTGSQNLIDRGIEIASGDTAQSALPAGQFPPRFAALVADTSVPLLVVTIESRGQSGRLLLENTVNGVDTWLSADMSALIIQKGMLRGTRGVGSELFAAEVSEPMKMILAGKNGFSDRFHSNLSGDDKISTRTYRCLVKTKGSAVINLEIGSIPTRVMTEDCESLDQSFTNTYWVSSNTGAIVQAAQMFGCST
jgi:hypothetical protein